MVTVATGIGITIAIDVASNSNGCSALLRPKMRLGLSDQALKLAKARGLKSPLAQPFCCLFCLFVLLVPAVFSQCAAAETFAKTLCPLGAGVGVASDSVFVASFLCGSSF